MGINLPDRKQTQPRTNDLPKRNAGIDIVRTIAILCVIGVHTLPQTVPLALGIGREGASVPLRVLTQFIQTLGQVGVPLFLVISGYLMLDKDYTGRNLRRFITHNLLPLLVSFEFWNLAMAAIKHYWITHDVSVAAVIKSALFLADPPMGHLWYLQMIFAAYCTLPLLALGLQKIRETHNEPYLWGFIIALLAFRSLVPTAEQYAAFLGHRPTIKIIYSPIVTDYSRVLVLLLIGYAIRRGLLMNLRDLLLVSLLIGSLLLLTADGYFRLMYGQPGTPMLPDTDNIFVLLAAMMICATVEKITSHRHLPKPVASVFQYLAQQTYGIYIIHFPIVYVLASFWHLTDSNWLNFVLYCLVAFIPSLLATTLLSRIPVIGRWLFLAKTSGPKTSTPATGR